MDRFAVAPFSPTDYAIHITGALVNLAVLTPAVVFLVTDPGVPAGGWAVLPLALLGLLIATYLADFVSGLLHWAFDTYFSDRNSTIKRMVVLVREHHIYPDKIFDYSVWREAGMLSWFGAILAAPFCAGALFATGLPGPVRAGLAVAALAASLEITFMLEFHKHGHRRERGRLVRTLQAGRVLLAPEHHLRHHAGRHDSHYCLINGFADDTLGRWGAFRGLERVIATVTGVAARQDDREVLAEFNRPVQ